MRAGGKVPAAGILSPTNPSKIQMMMEITHCDSVMNNGASSCKNTKYYGCEKCSVVLKPEKTYCNFQQVFIEGH